MFQVAVDFYIQKAESLVGVTAPGFEDKDATKDYIRMVCEDLRAGAKNPDKETNPDFVGIDGVAIEDYPKLVDKIMEVAKDKGLI